MGIIVSSLCAGVSDPQNTATIDPITNQITVTSIKNIVLPISQDCCNATYLSWMGNGPFIWQNGVCYYGSITPTDPILTCDVLFSTQNFDFSIDINNKVVLTKKSNGSLVSLDENCCNPSFLNPILGVNNYIWDNGVCYVNSVPPPPTIPEECIEISNPINVYNIGIKNEITVYGFTLTENCCNNVVLSYIDPQGNFIWQNGICYLNSAPPVPEPSTDSQKPRCCYNSDTPISVRLTTDNPDLNNQITQVETYSSSGDLFDTWVQLKATLPSTSVGYNFNLGLEITEGINCCCNYDIFVDDIQVTCTSGVTEEIYAGKCPGFNLVKVIDNKKSWVYNPGIAEVGTSVYDQIEREDGSFGTISGEGDINRYFAPSPDADIPWRYTDYQKQSGILERHSNLSINTKELWLTFDMCADCPISGTTLGCPEGFILGLTGDTNYCYTTGSGYTITPISETSSCYLLSSTTGSYSACTNYSLNVGRNYSGEVIISAGTLDQTFIYPTISSFNGGANVRSLATQSDGKILVGGDNFHTFSGVNLNYVNILRLNGDGTLDTTFNYSGTSYDTCREIVVQPDGKILVGWYSPNTNSNLLQRVNSDGSVDPTFNLLNFDQSGAVYAIKLNTDGSMYVCGSFPSVSGLSYGRIFKATSGGTIDTYFNTLSKVPSGDFVDIETLSDGTVVVIGGAVYPGTNVSRRISFINPDGTANTNYPPNRNTTPNMGPPIPFYSGGPNSVSFNSLCVNNDDIYVVGFNGYPTTSTKILKVKSGTTNFDPNFTLNVGISFDYNPNIIIVDSYGDLIVGGPFTTFNGIPTPGIAKLDTDGNLIQSFNVGSGFGSGQPINLAVTNDNNIVAVGFFNSYNGCNTNKVVKINNSTTTIPNCYNVVNSSLCSSCCSYTATNFVGPYSDSSCTIPVFSGTVITNTITLPTVGYLSLFELEEYKKQFQSFWVPFVEQFVPATTIWVAGERWCNDPCPTEIDCGFELTSEDATVQTVDEKPKNNVTGKSFTSTTPENLKSNATFGSVNGNEAVSENSNKNVVVIEDVGLVNQTVLVKTLNLNNIDIQAYRNKFSAYKTETIIE